MDQKYSNFIDCIIKKLSRERLEAYSRTASISDNSDVFAVYAWNMALCGSLYPLLQTIEVVLRNSMHDAICNKKCTKLWFCDQDLLRPLELRIIKHAEIGVRKVDGHLDVDHLVSELSFGFWTNLLDRRYEQSLWPGLLTSVFPYAPKFQRTRAIISKRFNKIRQLRNRVFHHQRIWHWRDLAQQHEQILEAVGWIEPAVRDFLMLVDNFNVVYTNGIIGYKEQVISLFNQNG